MRLVRIVSGFQYIDAYGSLRLLSAAPPTDTDYPKFLKLEVRVFCKKKSLKRLMGQSEFDPKNNPIFESWGWIFFR